MKMGWCRGKAALRRQYNADVQAVAHHVVPLVVALFRDTSAPEVAPMSYPVNMRHMTL